MPTSSLGPGQQPAVMKTEGLSALENFFFVRPLREVYSRVRQRQGSGLFERVLSEMRIQVRVAPEDLDRIPSSGAALVVANHPFGILDGAVLGALLTRIRKDVKLLTNYLLAGVEESRDLCIYLDPFTRASSHLVNTRGLRHAMNHLKSGGLLAMFPAGEVSHWQFSHGEVTDPEWSCVAARLARLTGAPVVPVFFAGRNSISYHVLGVVHPKLRTIQLPRQFLIKAGTETGLRVGTPVPAEKLRRIPSDQQATSYLRWRTYLLRRREQAVARTQPSCF